MEAENVYTVRQATMADCKALVALRVAMQSEIVRPNADTAAAFAAATRSYLETHLTDGSFCAWVAEAADGSGIVGTSGLVFFQRPPTFGNLAGIDGYVMNMYTDPAWRGKGIAAALLDAIVAHVRTTTAGRILLHAQPAARPVYERAGFTGRTDEMELRL